MSSQDRIERLRTAMAEESLDAFLITSGENRHYFSGFRGSAGYLWVTKDDAMLATDFRYTEQAGLQAPDYRIVRIGGGLDWQMPSPYDNAQGRLRSRSLPPQGDSCSIRGFLTWMQIQ